MSYIMWYWLITTHFYSMWFSIPFFAGHGSKPILIWQLSSKKRDDSLAWLLNVVWGWLGLNSCGLSSTPNNNMNIECHIHRYAVYRLAPFCATSWHVPHVQIGVLLSVSMPTCGSATWMGFEIQIAPGHWHRLMNSTQSPKISVDVHAISVSTFQHL